MPLYALKMLGILLDVNLGWAVDLQRLGLARRWAQWAGPGRPEVFFWGGGGDWGAVLWGGIWATGLPAAAEPLCCCCCLPLNYRAGISAPTTGPACRMFEWLEVNHPHNNVHNIHICRLLAHVSALATRGQLRSLQCSFGSLPMQKVDGRESDGQSL